MQVIVCPRCGMKNSGRSKRCAACGAPLAETAEEAEPKAFFPEEEPPRASEIPEDAGEEEGSEKEERKKLWPILLLAIIAAILIALIAFTAKALFGEGRKAAPPVPAATSAAALIETTAAPVRSEESVKMQRAVLTAPPEVTAEPEPSPADTPAPTAAPTKAPSPVPFETECPYFMFGGTRVMKGAESVEVKGDSSRAIHIPPNEVEDLLRYCPDLTSLVLNYCYMDDYSPLGELTKLTKLHLMSCRNNKVRDISWIGSLTRLSSLSLVNNDVTDTLPLIGLKRLVSLNLGGNVRLGEDACDNIGRIGGLRTLYLYSTGIEDIGGLAGCVSLTHLNLRSNEKITDISVIQYMKQLETLQISGTGLKTFDTLVKYGDSIRELWVDRLSLPVNAYRQLQKMKSLATVVISKNSTKVTPERLKSYLGRGVAIKFAEDMS